MHTPLENFYGVADAVTEPPRTTSADLLRPLATRL